VFPPGATGAGDWLSSATQVRGFGFLHDGSVDTVFDFLHASVFNFRSNPDTKRRAGRGVPDGLDTASRRSSASRYRGDADDLADPTVTARRQPHDRARQRGRLRPGREGHPRGEARGCSTASAGQFESDRASEPLLTEATLRGRGCDAGQS